MTRARFYASSQTCWTFLFTLAFLVLSLTGCSSGPNISSMLNRLDNPPEKLSAWGLFQGEMKEHSLNTGVLPYNIATPLFSDYALKYRAVWMPSGTSAEADAKGVFSFPTGTLLLKTFAYPNPDGSRRLVETRLLVKSSDGWHAFPYVWNAEQSDARLALVGDTTEVNWTHSDGTKLSFTYVVPNSNECKNCHEIEKKLQPLGPKASQLNNDYTYSDGAENQLTRWIKAGYLKDDGKAKSIPSFPDWWDPNSGTVEQRARAYLDANCAHCHQRSAPASNSALYLDAATTNPNDLGVCKPPVAAGKGAGDLKYGIVPGKPEQSILLHRMLSDESEIRMPELGRVVGHREGIALIRAWIQQMKGSCDSP